MKSKAKQLKIKFLGATGTVTGSRYLLTYNNKKLLIDCGMFQGLKQLRLRNWSPFPINPTEIDAILITHAHLDHTGYLPRIVKMGFTGPAYCTHATKALCGILLPDAAHIQEEDAKFLNKHGLSKHNPALPLYTAEDADKSFNQIKSVDWNTFTEHSGFRFRFHPISHLLGASCIEIEVAGKRILFSGDVGRSNDPILPERSIIKNINYLVVESTYGDRLHPKNDIKESLSEIINKTINKKGIVLIPSFAIGRAQALIYILHQLKASGKIPDVPVYLNSPMSIQATKTHYEFDKDLKQSKKELEEVFKHVNYVHSATQSKQLNNIRVPAIILSSSGMITAGRILHHIKAFGPNPDNAIVIVGFQAAGTRGELLVRGKKEVKIHGKPVSINAKVYNIQNMSGHADYQGIINWLKSCNISPKQTFITHGEPTSSDEMRFHLQETFGWNCCVPEHLQEIDL